MAYLRLISGREEALTPEHGLHLWRVLQGQEDPRDTKSERLALEAKAIYLNWRSAPDDYLQARRRALIPEVLGQWVRKADGNYDRPEWGDADCLRVSKVLGLWSQGQPTFLYATKKGELLDEKGATISWLKPQQSRELVAR